MWKLFDFTKQDKTSSLRYDRASESNIYTISGDVRPLADEIAELVQLEKRSVQEPSSRNT